MENYSTVIIGAGAIGTGLSFFTKNSILFGKKNSPPAINNTIIKDYTNNLKYIKNAKNIIFAVKAYSLISALKQYKDYIDINSNILIVCNGFYHKIFAKRYLKRIKNIFSGFTTLAVKKIKENHFKIINKGILKVCPLNNKKSVLNLNTINIEYDDFYKASWEKGVINTCINIPASYFMVKNGEILKNPEIYKKFKIIYNEIKYLSQRLNKKCPDILMIESIITKTSENLCSTLTDIYSNKKNELPYITGYILKIAKKHNILLPQTELLYKKVNENF